MACVLLPGPPGPRDLIELSIHLCGFQRPLHHALSSQLRVGVDEGPQVLQQAPGGVQLQGDFIGQVQQVRHVPRQDLGVELAEPRRGVAGGVVLGVVPDLDAVLAAGAVEFQDPAAGAPAAVGDKMGWSLEELQAALAKLPAGSCVLDPGETRESIFEAMFGDSLDQFVDWEAGKARFDSPEFRAILEFCAAFPAQAPAVEDGTDAYTRVASGEQLLLPVYLSDLQSIQLYRALFGGGVTFAGYPSEGGSGVRFSADGGLAMSASCADMDAAWSFLRQTLLPDEEAISLGADFPVNRAAFERKAEESMAFSYLTDETGNTITGPDGEPMMEGTAYVFVGGQAIMLISF